MAMKTSSKMTTLLALSAAILANASLALAGRSPIADAPFGQRESGSSVNFLDVRQFRLEDARVPGASARQCVTAWQVNTGSWNGQSLDGLSMVMVETGPSQESGARQLCCYVSEYATPAQREALLAAMRSTQANLRDTEIRLEPAVIRIENSGDSAVIHLALVA